MLRRWTGWCALVACLPHLAFAQDSQDPFLDPRGVVETAGFETDAAAAPAATSPSPIRQAGFAGELQPAEGTTDDTSGFSVFDSDPLSDGPVFPDGTQTIQYPLDDDAYRGVPEAIPGSAPPSWTPPVVPSPVSVEPWIGHKSSKVTWTELFGDAGTFDISSLVLKSTLEFPRGAPGLFLTPHFGLHLLEGPVSTDLPSKLYDFSLDMALWRPVGDNWMLQFTFAPSVFTDGKNTSSDALRLIGRAMGYYTYSEACQLVLGIVYLDREDLPVLPAFGVVYQPREDLKYELMFPKPRLAWRQYANADFEQWVYVTGELGGGSWAIERVSGLDDIATYRDLRIVLGLERKLTAGCSWLVEGGVVFSREIEYTSGIGDTSPNNTAFLRLGGSF
jgi:hypothetical protein